MKKFFDSIRYSRHLYVAAFVTFLSIFGLSCSKDDTPVIVPPDNTTGTEKKFMFCYDLDDGSYFHTDFLGSSFESRIDAGTYLSDWYKMAGVRSGGRQFIFMHASYNPYFGDTKYYSIREVLPNGSMGDETESGTWDHNYETVIGFQLGNRGFIFGQDSYSNHHWFVQEITSEGKLADRESDRGDWNNFYPAATPLYVGDQTFLFFQTSSNDNYWFITHVSASGTLTDSDDGYWANLWPTVTSYQVDGKTFLIGERVNGATFGGGEWFIQQINSNGTMGAETDRGNWEMYYRDLVAYTLNGQAYLFGASASDQNYHPRNYFFQKLGSNGRLGEETSHATSDRDYDFFFPFDVFDSPGSFRYTIGWDLTKSTGAPSRPWSTMVLDPWNGPIKFGGGAALANIDGDANGRLDAVLMGIQSQKGGDRFYYKVAWNLGNTGEASGWSEDIFGPHVGAMQSGGGADIADIDRNGVPDLVLMSVDNPEGANSFWYSIGWNLSASGQPASWSGMFHQDGLGFDNAGGGLALGDLDGNGQPEMVLVAIDDPAGANQFWYRIGRNLDQSGNAASWTGNIAAPSYVGYQSAGGGAALADLNGNGKPDLVLMDIDNPQGPNPFWCYVGWDIDINGNAVSWSSFTGPSLGNMTLGGGAAIGDVDKNGIMDLLLMTIDNPYGKD